MLDSVLSIRWWWCRCTIHLVTTNDSYPSLDSIANILLATTTLVVEATVLYKINDGFSFWWDSFGFPAPEEIEDLLHKYEYNKKQIQDIKSTSCGFYCIAFIKFMINKQDKMKAFNTFCNLFRANTIDNEIILHQLLY